jgi:hypothetical protein
MGKDAKATLRTVLEEDDNLLFVPLTDDQLGLLFDNYPKIRTKYGLHDSNPIYFVLDQTTGRASIYITCQQSSFLFAAGDKLSKMGLLELITSMFDLFLFLKNAPNRQKYFGQFASSEDSLLWQVRTREGAKELTQHGHDAGLIDKKTVIAASTVRGGENGGLCGGLNDPRVVPKQAELDRLLKAPEKDRDPAAIKAAEEALREAIDARETTRKGKRKAGACGGDEDYRVDKAQAEREKLLEATVQDPALIKVAGEKLELALTKKEKTRKGKSDGGKKGGKKGGKYVH